MDFETLLQAVQKEGPWLEFGPWVDWVECRWCGVYEGQPHKTDCFWLEIEAAGVINATKER